MLPELFEIPFIHVTVKSYGLMMVLGFLAAVFVLRRLAKRIAENPEYITNAALYSLISGVIGARIFYVVHYFEDKFSGNLASVFAIWNGGLEFLGGVVLAMIVLLIYLNRQKLFVARYFDMLVIGVMIGLAFGRIGCYLNSCCFGAPTDSVCAITFPYDSFPYKSQVYPNAQRNRITPQLELPYEYYGYQGEGGETWFPADNSNKYNAYLKPRHLLTPEQEKEVTMGKFRGLPVHPTQFYSSANALFIALLLYLFWRKNAVIKPGCTFALMLILYGATRFGLECLRDDNPLEQAWWAIYKGATVSQNIGIYLVIAGVVLMTILTKFKPAKPRKAIRKSTAAKRKKVVKRTTKKENPTVAAAKVKKDSIGNVKEDVKGDVKGNLKESMDTPGSTNPVTKTPAGPTDTPE